VAGAYPGLRRDADVSWIGFALIVLIMVASITLAEPTNSKFRRLPEGKAPDRVDQLRITWCRFQRARTVVALGALACLVAASVQHSQCRGHTAGGSTSRRQ
jgi:hypothetical protein